MSPFGIHFHRHQWESIHAQGKDYFAGYRLSRGELCCCKSCNTYLVRLNTLAPIGDNGHTVWLTITGKV